MTSNHLIRFTQALVLAALVAALAAPAAALGGSNPSKPAPDWFERYASAHPYGQGTLAASTAPDWFERYAATHAPTVLVDGRSPDTLGAARLQVVDERSPDTLDAAPALQSIALVQPGSFDWGDAGIGAGMGMALLALMGSSILLLMRLQRRHRVRTA